MSYVTRFLRWGGRKWFPIFLVSVSLALLCPACGGSKPAVTTREVKADVGDSVSVGNDVTVRIPASALASNTSLTIARATEGDPAPGELEDAKPLGPGFKIDLAGQPLLKPVTIEMAFDPSLLPPDTPTGAVFLAFYDEEKNEWVPVDSTVDLERHVVTVETDHLSWWKPWTWDLSALADKIKRKVQELLELTGLPSAEIPNCRLSPKHMAVEFNELLLACIEETGGNGEAVLRVANNRAYAVLIHPPAGVELRWASHGSLSDAAATLLEDKLGQGAVYVPPAGAAEFLLRFEDAGDIRLLSAPSDLTLALDLLLTILSMVGADPDNLVKGVECLFEVMVPDTPEPRTVGDLLDVAKDCAGVALKGRAGILWGTVRAFVTVGAGTGELLVDRTFGGDQGEVIVRYRPPAPTPTPTPASELIATEVITVDLNARPGQELVGGCWTGSIAVLRPNAWRCSDSDHRIHDPCFSSSPTDTFVICHPFPPGEGVKLNLTEPLPVSQAHEIDRFDGWRLELNDGTKCDYILWPTGTIPESIAPMMGAGLKFECNDGWYVAGVRRGDVWMANKVQWSENLGQVVESIQVPVGTVWR